MLAVIRTLVALGMSVGLAGCVSDPAPVPVPLGSYPFAGTWNCEGRVFTFTDTTWSSGSRTLRIFDVTRDGSSYSLAVAGGSMIALALVTDTGMTWVSGKTGDQLTCRRMG